MSQVENNKQKQYITNSKKANKIIRFRTLMASGLGFIPVPLLDAAAILSVQLWMLRDISKVYDIPFKKNVARSIIGTLVTNIGAISVLKFIPGINLLGGGAVAMSAGASTYALGKVFTQHFDQGGTLLSFDPVKSRAYFEQVYEESKITVEELKEQEDSFKEVDNQALASIAILKKTNSELMTTITNLENQLKESKKERTTAVAAVTPNPKTKQTLSNLNNQLKKRRKWRRIIAIIVILGLIILALFQFNIIGNNFESSNSNPTDSLNTANIISSNNENVAQETKPSVIDTTATINNPADSANTSVNDTINQQIQLDNSNFSPPDSGTSSVTPQDTSSGILTN